MTLVLLSIAIALLVWSLLRAIGVALTADSREGAKCVEVSLRGLARRRGDAEERRGLMDGMRI